MFRAVLPIVKKGTKALGEELLKSGVNAVEDIWRTGDLATTKKSCLRTFQTVYLIICSEVDIKIC